MNLRLENAVQNLFGLPSEVKATCQVPRTGESQTYTKTLGLYVCCSYVSYGHVCGLKTLKVVLHIKTCQMTFTWLLVQYINLCLYVLTKKVVQSYYAHTNADAH